MRTFHAPGGATNSWGYSGGSALAPSDINASNFGWHLQNQNTGGAASTYVYYARMKVHFAVSIMELTANGIVLGVPVLANPAPHQTHKLASVAFVEVGPRPRHRAATADPIDVGGRC